jgi:hypothetical protein
VDEHPYSLSLALPLKTANSRKSSEFTKTSEKFLLIRYYPPERGLPMRASDSSGGNEAGQFSTTRRRRALVMASVHDQSQTGRAAWTSLCRIYWRQCISLDMGTPENRYRLESADYLMAEAGIRARAATRSSLRKDG